MDIATNLSGYRITEQLYAGHRTLVYRGIREIDQQPIVIKRLRSEFPSFNELAQFCNQYAIANSISSPSIIETYSLEPYNNSYALILEDFGGISLKEWAIKGLREISLRNFLQIAITLADILDTLHINKVIHKDIKPANILVNPETKQVKLIDFSIASLLPRETIEIQNINSLEGTLAYLSPEQTGRMNRAIDYRSDFYSLGITFYELLTKKLPFESNDPLELVHCHLAKSPVPVHQIKDNIPLALSEIINKLMAKNAEDRYQTALGIKHDLEICLEQLQRTETIGLFPLGERDISDRFLIPEKLYGRQVEVAILLNAFDRVSNGTTELMLIAGFSGIGKTAVVNEVHKPIVRQRGNFIKGKYDQFQRNIPFSAFVQAFRDLMTQLLSESDSHLQKWKTKILESVGENGRVLIEVIPELERIIGQQPLVPELSGIASENRFNLLMQRFVQVFTNPEHPLVLFLDDLQWADSASLKLLDLLMQDTGYLLVIGAYRDNEVSAAHPVSLTVDAIQKNGATVNRISMKPLSLEDTNQLVADTLNCDRQLAQPLTELLYQKTKGNPFFAIQFLKSLYEDGLIEFDSSLRYWQCHIAQVRSLAITDDVVKFMTLQLQRLPNQTQEMLKLAACIGANFDLQTLSVVSKESPEQVASTLWIALQEGLILPISDVYAFFTQSDSTSIAQSATKVTYKFLHDRVQQAAYSMIPEEQKRATHLQIGQLLLVNSSNIEREENIFAIVNQLNMGKGLITEETERNQLIQLNLIAARKAQSSTAYGVAIKYLKTIILLLPQDSWYSQYDLTKSVYELAAESAYLGTNYEQMEQLSAIFLSHVDHLIDKIRIYEIQMLAARAQGKLLESIEIGIQLLKLLEVEIPAQPNPEHVRQALDVTHLAWKDRAIAGLIDLPVMQDPIKLAAMRILSVMIAPAYQSVPALLPMLITKQINLCIADGNSSISTFSYADYGLLLCGIVGDLEAGYEFGQLALNIFDYFQEKAHKCRAYFIVHSYISHWKEALSRQLPFLQEAYQAGLDAGDLEDAALSGQMYCAYAYFAGHELQSLALEMETYRQGLLQLKQQHVLNFNLIFHQTVLNLLGHSVNPCQLEGEIFVEMQALPVLQKSNLRSAIYYLYHNKSVLCYWFEQYEWARDYALLVESYADSMVGMYAIPLSCFYSSLIYLKLYTSVSESEQAHYLEKVASNQDNLQRWAEYAPMNHLHKFYLVDAERYRVLENKANAIEFYDRAIQIAQENGYLQEEAVACELAAKFYLAWGKEKIAQSYMTDAYYAYSRWGAKAKVENLETRYPQLLFQILQRQQQSLSSTETIFTASSHTSKASTGSTSISEALDLASILKASHSLSSEIELEKLLSTFLHIVAENAGADKCVLLMPKDDEWVVEALSQIEQQEKILQSISIADSQIVPLSLINTIKNSLKPSVISDAIFHPTLSNDPYILANSPKSILCNPILNQGKLIGILYLENSLTVGAFTSDRVELLNLICAQAAISLQNARLYADEQEKSQIIQQSAIELERFQSKLMFLIERTPIGVIEWDAEFKVIGWNPAAEKIFGYKAMEMLNNHALEIVPETYQAYVVDLMTDILNQKGGTYSVNENITKDSRVIICEWINTPLLDAKGQPIGIYSMVQDITERKQIEAERQQKSEALEKALRELQQTQIQLIQGEKMSALGNLVAGVAHEINNPVGFLGGNIRPALDHVNDIFGLLDLYQQKYPNPDREIQDEIETIDLEYLREDLPKLVSSMREGVTRIRDISNSLRTFSRADSDRPVACNIHDGLNSTIMILKHRLKGDSSRPEIQVIKEYGDLPQVECFAGQLNQVFMNLLANAIDALEESNQGLSYNDIAANPNRIIIRTSITNGQSVEICIVDNGKGMSEDIRQHIFDHLFTTKGVGKGTGLGLAIAKQIIVEKHRGTITVNSELGVGTEFVISLPIN